MIELKSALLEVFSLESLANILKDSSAKVSFFGRRYLENNNFSSTASIDFVAKKALSMIHPLLKDWNYSLKDRKNISIIMRSLNGFYEKTDEDLCKCNIITKIFNYLINLFSIIYPIRRKWTKLPDLCNFYTKKQYIIAFPKNPLPEEHDEFYKGKKLYLSPENVAKKWFLK